MVTSALSSAVEQEVVFAASAPGGPARQYRVQVPGTGSAIRWRLHASFRDAPSAHSCLEALRRQGEAARLVVYRTLPCAA